MTPPVQLDAAALEEAGARVKRVFTELHKVVIGQDAVLAQMLVALLCRSHCLLVGVPGLAKTLIVRSLGQACAVQFRRVQFTPDLMPSDILGTDILEEDPATRHRSFKFVKGPVFTNFLLADEINRTPPKTQAALLEAMQESSVTAGGQTYQLAPPFFVLATQNPIEQEGTYPLPEAQLDRFMFMISIDYPSEEEEEKIVAATTREEAAAPAAVIDAAEIIRLQSVVRRVPVSPHVIKYATRLARATRPADPAAPKFIKDYVTWGCGPRAAQFLVLGAKARAVMAGRANVSCADVRSLALPVMRHRMSTNFNADAEGLKVDQIIGKLLDEVKPPDEKDYR